MRHLPTHLLVDRCDHYARTIPSRDNAGGQLEGFAAIPTNRNIPCKFFDIQSGLLGDYWQRDELEQPAVFLIDKSVYEQIQEKDRIVFRGDNYRVESKHNLAYQDCVFKLTLRNEIP